MTRGAAGEPVGDREVWDVGMSTVVDPTASSEARDVALNRLDYYAHRRRLFTALRSLAPGQEMELSSDRAEDVYWLRYELEARMSQRYSWPAPLETPAAARVIVRLPASERPRARRPGAGALRRRHHSIGEPSATGWLEIPGDRTVKCPNTSRPP